MIYLEIDVSESIDVNRSSACKGCIICHYSYFLDKVLRFQPTICNNFHDVLMMSIEINNIAIWNIHGVDYRSTIYSGLRYLIVDICKTHKKTFFITKMSSKNTTNET